MKASIYARSTFWSCEVRFSELEISGGAYAGNEELKPADMRSDMMLDDYHPNGSS